MTSAGYSRFVSVRRGVETSTDLDVGVFDDPSEVFQHRDVRRCPGVESSE
jgi:hypothetical protein